MQIFFYIVTNNVLPLFVIVFLGYLLAKKFPIDIGTLSKAYFYIFLPAFIFKNLYVAEMSKDMLLVLGFVILLMLINFAICKAVGRLRGFSLGKQGAFSNAVMFYNSGNLGLSLITLVFSGTPYFELAVTIQITVLVFQNVTSIVIGMLQAAQSDFDWRELAKKIGGMPTLWTILIALLLRSSPLDLQAIPVIWMPVSYASNGLIALALLTLGVQLRYSRFALNDKDVYLAAGLRLLGGPILAAVLLFLLRIKAPLANVLIISSAVPTAVNTALIAVEFDNEKDFASQMVLFSTVFSALSLAVVIFITRLLFPI